MKDWENKLNQTGIWLLNLIAIKLHPLKSTFNLTAHSEQIYHKSRLNFKHTLTLTHFPSTHYFSLKIKNNFKQLKDHVFNLSKK